MSAIGKLFSPKVKTPDATPLPDQDSPEVKAAAMQKKMAVMSRGGRSSTNLSGGGSTYGSSLLGQ